MSKASDRKADDKPSGHFSADAVKITAKGSELDVQEVEADLVPEVTPKAPRPKAALPEPEDETEPAPGVDSRLADSPVPDRRKGKLPEPRLGSKVVNAPTAQNNGGFETKVVAPAHAPADKTAGTNTSMAAYAYELRVTQEQGTH